MAVQREAGRGNFDQTVGNLLVDQNPSTAHTWKAIDQATLDFRAACCNDPGASLRVHFDLGGRELQQAAKLDENEPSIHYVLGNAYMAIGRLSEAADAFAATLRLDPRRADAHDKLGLVYTEQSHVPLGAAMADQDKLAAAVKEHRKAVELSPDNGWFQHNLGMAYERQRNYGEAAAQRRSLSMRRPSNSTTSTQKRISVSPTPISSKGIAKRARGKCRYSASSAKATSPNSNAASP